MTSTNSREVKYIYQLPYYEHKELCRLLDHNDKWEELGGKHMNFDMMTIHELRRFFVRGLSPSEELLNRWGHQNHTILELFALLSKMCYYRAMMILKPFVDPQYHHFIYEGEQFLDLTERAKYLEELKNNKSNVPVLSPSVVPQANSSVADKDLHVGIHNLNLPSEAARRPASKLIFPPTTSSPEAKAPNTVVQRTEQSGNISNDNNEYATVEAGAVNAGSPAVNTPAAPEVAAAAEPENKDSNVPGINTQRKMSNASDVSSIAESCGTIPDIPYKELMVATNGWDKHTILGKGGFGTVFKGIWKNTPVAIKRLEQRTESDESYQAQIEQSLRELRVLNACRHDNILPIYGFSMGGDEPCLVYQYMPNGSVEDRLLCRNGTPPLSWDQRHNIAEGTARGLQFLHNNKKPFIHGDIKSANILLDTNFEPRIGDFGLARDGPQGHYTHMKVSRVHGTRPYLPDEFLRSKQISTKVDTYSFGIVLFELATGQRAYDESRQKKFLKDHVEACEDQQILTLADRKAGPCDQATFLELVELGKLCVRKRAKDRPEMEEVLKQLEGMSNRRRIASRAQNMVRQLTPSTPYELQLLHDICSQQRRMSSPSASPAASPQPYAVPDLTPGAPNLPFISPLYHLHQQQQQQQVLPQQQQIPGGLASPVLANNRFFDVVSNGNAQKMNVHPEDENRLVYNIQRNVPSPLPYEGNFNNIVETAVPNEMKLNGVVDSVILNTPRKQNVHPNSGGSINPFQMNSLQKAVNLVANGAADNLNIDGQILNLPSRPTVLPSLIKTSAESVASHLGQNDFGLPLTIPAAAPLIAVTPPTASSFSKHIPVAEESATQNNSKSEKVEERDAVLVVNNFAPGEASVGGLPLLSALGIKNEDNIRSDSNNADSSSVNESTHML
ncbi:interleukin-1 receptor-associated kinase 1-like [Schistocerca cancellata]|uniref:interleukin-1 receptor-associated kinase 1-like n=1 Tax=Schistocerca cancellata TaxID=274614 RepID=UPI0021197B6A|nr:interleukin-1 receptor-associated kinase 1-like [Schistocerca cancellata]XP_049787338.1 interleukin-1 receptor-associated kinase 1-like [Schistocerca cancellata]